MKHFKLLFIQAIVLSFAFVLTSCSDEGDASIENHLVVEQVKTTEHQNNCQNCLSNSYQYRIKLKSHSGSVYYYTNYKHEIGDTLLSIFEFTDSRESIIKKMESNADSLSDVNKKVQKKNKELELYNELLMGIIQENALKSN